MPLNYKTMHDEIIQFSIDELHEEAFELGAEIANIKRQIGIAEAKHQEENGLLDKINTKWYHDAKYAKRIKEEQLKVVNKEILKRNKEFSDKRKQDISYNFLEVAKRVLDSKSFNDVMKETLHIVNSQKSIYID